jgi:DNA-binding Lrp family transcriptional regulator
LQRPFLAEEHRDRQNPAEYVRERVQRVRARSAAGGHVEFHHDGHDHRGADVHQPDPERGAESSHAVTVRDQPHSGNGRARPEWQDAVMTFDELDERIVAALVDNARATYAEVGASVGLSAPAVKRRVDRLRASGAITGFSARVNPAAMGWTTEAYVELFCRGRTSPADIAAAVSRYPEVIAAATITGEANALLHIRAADVRHFERVVERIGAEPFVVRTRSVIVLSRLVNRPDVLPPGALE